MAFWVCDSLALVTIPEMPDASIPGKLTSDKVMTLRVSNLTGSSKGCCQQLDFAGHLRPGFRLLDILCLGPWHTLTMSIAVPMPSSLWVVFQADLVGSKLLPESPTFHGWTPQFGLLANVFCFKADSEYLLMVNHQWSHVFATHPPSPTSQNIHNYTELYYIYFLHQLQVEHTSCHTWVGRFVFMGHLPLIKKSENWKASTIFCGFLGQKTMKTHQLFPLFGFSLGNSGTAAGPSSPCSAPCVRSCDACGAGKVVPWRRISHWGCGRRRSGPLGAVEPWWFWCGFRKIGLYPQII